MILVTIGSLFPFDRMVRLVDEMVPTLPGETFFAQIGEGGYQPVNMPFAVMLSRREFNEKVAAARLIVAHAGMGSVITAMQTGKPIVILPRIFAAGEHTTDHQMATARWLQGKPGVHVCLDDRDLRDTIVRVLEAPGEQEAMTPSAPKEFIDRIRSFIAAA